MMSNQWQCFRCDRVYSKKVKFCPNCGTPQVTEPDPENLEDNSWIVVVVVTILFGLALPFIGWILFL